MLATYGRLLHIILRDPGFLPLGSAAKHHKRKGPQSRNLRHKKDQEKGQGEETVGRPYTATSETSVERDDNADSPGLELFYTKRVFVCSQDGRPKWCTEVGIAQAFQAEKLSNNFSAPTGSQIELTTARISDDVCTRWTIIVLGSAA